MKRWIEEIGMITPGGDPCWKCPECGGDIHIYGIESQDNHHNMCNSCKKTLLYPGEKVNILLMYDWPYYHGYTILEEPIDFNILFKDKNYTVYVYDISLYGFDSGQYHTYGFSGVFDWKDNKIIDIDYDDYTEDTTVYGYKIEGDSLCILV